MTRHDDRRTSRNLQRQEVMSCGLHTLTLIWVAATLFSFFVMKHPEYHKLIQTNFWIPFTFIGSTMVWVVLSRVVGSHARLFLFTLWVITLLAFAAWAATGETAGPPSVFGFTTLAAVFVVLSALTTQLSFKHLFRTSFYYMSTAILVTGLMYVFTPLFPFFTNQWFDPLYIWAAAAVIFFTGFQMWHTGLYLEHNKDLWRIQDTCMFAVMAPWTEAIDTFSVLSRFNEP